MAHSNKFTKGDRYYDRSILNEDCEETRIEETGIDEDDWNKCKLIITSLGNVDTILQNY